MEASTSFLSKKRKQPSSSTTRATATTISSSTSNPFTGILTRGKIQKFFFHQNRSGTSRKSRSFPTSFTNPSLLTSKNLAKLNNVSVVEDDDDDDEIYHISIKDLRARRVFSKPPKSNDLGKISNDLAGKNVNSRFDCGLIGGKLDESDCGSVVQNPNLLEKCVDLKEGVLIDGKWDESDCKFDGNHTVVESPNLLEKCVDINKGLKDVKPNLLISDMCDASRVNYEMEASSGGNPVVLISEMCADSRVYCEKEGLIGGNPNDFRVNCKEEGLIRETPKLSKCDSTVDCEKEGLNGGNLSLSLCESRVDCNGESLDGAKGDCGDRVSDKLSPYLCRNGMHCRSGERSEENVQTTPPDAVVFIKHRDDQSILQNKSAESRSPPKQISPGKGGNAEAKKSFSNPRRHLGLNPCSRLKLFKAPNSFSYRRMLPFLMDLAKDEPSGPTSNPSIKIETDIETKPLVSSSQESVIDTAKLHKKLLEPEAPCKPQEMNIDSKEEEKLSLDSKTSDSSAEQAAPCTTIDCLGKNQENSISNESHLGILVSNDPKTGEVSPDVQVISLGKPEDTSSITVSDLTIMLVNPKTSSEPSGEDATLNTQSLLSLHAEGECMAAHAKFKPEIISFSEAHSSSKLDVVVSSGGSGFDVAKGILKKNPRGCRGICNCLSCASFRLNSERAFEFSRNQWLDAEELAMDLIKELSSLRTVLENCVNGSNDNAIVPVDQVQEICKSASSVEDMARSRLSQMNEDLHVHCRIKPFGVTDLAR